MLPFLYNDAVVARVDVKADREAGRLLVHSVHWEDAAPHSAREALREELAALASWLELRV